MWFQDCFFLLIVLRFILSLKRNGTSWSSKMFLNLVNVLSLGVKNCLVLVALHASYRDPSKVHNLVLIKLKCMDLVYIYSFVIKWLLQLHTLTLVYFKFYLYLMPDLLVIQKKICRWNLFGTIFLFNWKSFFIVLFC